MIVRESAQTADIGLPQTRTDVFDCVSLQPAARACAHTKTNTHLGVHADTALGVSCEMPTFCPPIIRFIIRTSDEAVVVLLIFPLTLHPPFNPFAFMVFIMFTQGLRFIINLLTFIPSHMTTAQEKSSIHNEIFSEEKNGGNLLLCLIP